jgi:hypothetical protein
MFDESRENFWEFLTAESAPTGRRAFPSYQKHCGHHPEHIHTRTMERSCATFQSCVELVRSIFALRRTDCCARDIRIAPDKLVGFRKEL